MKITLSVNYRTRWGEAVYISGNISELGLDDIHAALPILHVN